MSALTWHARLQALRRDRHVPQRVLAKLLGLDVKGVSCRERGLRHLSVEELGIYVGLLGLSDAEIVDVVRRAVPPVDWHRRRSAA